MPADTDPGFCSPYIFNQNGRGLAIRDARGDLHELADVSIACRAPLSNASYSVWGFLWTIQFNKLGGTRRDVFIEKAKNQYPDKFEAAIDSQTGLACLFKLGKFKKYWTKFIEERVEKVLNDPQRTKKYFVEILGLQDQLLSKTDGREKERWVFSPEVILDSNGRKLTGSKNDMYWYRSLLEKNALPIKPSSSIPARCGREVYAEFVKMSNKQNFFTYNLCLAGGSVLLHSRLVRKTNGGQGPLHVYYGKGKSQGKSTTAETVLHLTGDITNGRKLAPIDIRTIKQYSSRSTLPILVEDVAGTKLLCELAQARFDDGQVYGNSKGQFRVVAEFFATTNDIDPKKVTERDTDRMAVFPFKNSTSHAIDHSNQRSDYFQLLATEEKPFDFMVGEMGNFFASAEYLEMRDRWASILYENCTGLVKERTVLTNYAPVYAAMEYIYGVFNPVFEQLEVSWEDFQTFARTTHTEQMQVLHVETDHAESYVRRYCLGLLDWAQSQNIQKRLQHLRMVNTKKIKCGYALGVAPAGESALKHLKGAILPHVKQHVLALGGRVDSPEDHVTIALLKDCVDLPEDLDEVSPQGEYSVNKRGILIPGDSLPSSLWIELCKALNQTERFGSVDEESPTGMTLSQSCMSQEQPSQEPPLESTGNSRKSLGLRLDYSSILPSNNQELGPGDDNDDAQDDSTLDFGDEDDFNPTEPDVRSPTMAPPTSTAMGDVASPTDVDKAAPAPVETILEDILEEGIESDDIFEERNEVQSKQPPIPQEYTCGICGSKWSNARKRNGHMSSCRKKNQSLVTTHPQGTASSSSDASRRLTRNSQSEASDTLPASQPSTFPCDQCDRTFPSTRSRSSHKRVHKKTSETLPM